jgi:hypothetical protein
MIVSISSVFNFGKGSVEITYTSSAFDPDFYPITIIFFELSQRTSNLKETAWEASMA